jgi:PAS domain S-box-containing protein
LGVEGSQVSTLIDLAAVAALLAAAALAVSAGRQSVSAPRTLVWRYLAVGFGLWAAAGSLRLAVERAGAAPGRATPAEWLELAGAIAVATGLAAYPVQPRDRFGRLRGLLDVSILAIAVLALTWLVMVRPVLWVGFVSPGSLFWQSAALSFDAIWLLFLVRLLLLVREPREAAAFRLLLLGATLVTAADMAAGYRVVLGGSLPATLGPLLTLIAAGVIALACWAAHRRPEASPAAPSSAPAYTRLEGLLPFAVTYLEVGFTAIDGWANGSIDPGGLIGAVALSLLLVARQGVIGGQVEMRQFATLVNSTSDLAFVCDSSGRLVLSNPALRRAMGLAEGADAGQLRVADFAPDLVPKLASPVESKSEVEFRGAGGRRVPVAVSLQPVRDERGGRVLWAATAFDLSEVKQREQELRGAFDEVARHRSRLESWNAELEEKVRSRTEQLAQSVADLQRLNEELKELDRLKTEFVALVSHELRAPLANIQSGLELTLGAPEGLNASAQSALRLVEAEARRLSRFVESVLDLSALEAGRITLHPVAVSVEAAARAAFERFPPGAGPSRLELRVPVGLPPVWADERALGSVFFHLLDNALKYAEQGAVRVEARTDDGTVQVSVSDEGPGVPAQDRERVFDMFHRVDASDARRVYGHGLGLPLTRRLLQAMGGGIELAPTEAKGARFVFWLPAAGWGGDRADGRDP